MKEINPNYFNKSPRIIHFDGNSDYLPIHDDYLEAYFYQMFLNQFRGASNEGN